MGVQSPGSWVRGKNKPGKPWTVISGELTHQVMARHPSISWSRTVGDKSGYGGPPVLLTCSHWLTVIFSYEIQLLLHFFPLDWLTLKHLNACFGLILSISICKTWVCQANGSFVKAKLVTSYSPSPHKKSSNSRWNTFFQEEGIFKSPWKVQTMKEFTWFY